MADRAPLPLEFAKLGEWLAAARSRQKITQRELALRCRIAQSRIALIENGVVLPTLPQLMRLSKALFVPIQWFLTGAKSPGAELSDLALELHGLGVVDLAVPDALVPGAFRPTEAVLALAVTGSQPNPRIVEAVPAMLAWNVWSPALLRAYGRLHDPRVGFRLAWLAELTLTINRLSKFPGGCPARHELEVAVGTWSRAFQRRPPATEDDLGRPGGGNSSTPLWKRWKISYGATLADFLGRARHLHRLRQRQHSNSNPFSEPSGE